MSDEQKPEDNAPAEGDEARDDEEQADSELSGDEEPTDDTEPSDGEEPVDGDEPSNDEEPADSKLSGDEAEGSADEQEEDQAEETGPTPGIFDGLDSGLAWYGEDAFEPPLPAGYLPPPELPEGAAAPAGMDRSQRIKDRLASRRAETEAEKKWFQRIPTPIWICMPATVFIIIWIVVFAKPWQQIPEPGADKKFDESLLKGHNVEDSAARAKALHIRERVPALTWKILPGDILGMKLRKSSAKVVFEPSEAKNFTASCEVCIVDTLADYSVWLQVHTSRGVGLVGSGRDGSPSGPACKKPDATGQTVQWVQEMPEDKMMNHWYSLALRVEDGTCTYYVNGKALPHTPAAPQEVEAITLVAANAQIYVRDWKVTVPTP